jgi:hypothetical protein
MKFMLMMNAPRGSGDWAVNDWTPEDLKGHLGLMLRFHEERQRLLTARSRRPRSFSRATGSSMSRARSAPTRSRRGPRPLRAAAALR